MAQSYIAGRFRQGSPRRKQACWREKQLNLSLIQMLQKRNLLPMFARSSRWTSHKEQSESLRTLAFPSEQVDTALESARFDRASAERKSAQLSFVAHSRIDRYSRILPQTEFTRYLDRRSCSSFAGFATELKQDLRQRRSLRSSPTALRKLFDSRVFPYLSD